MPPAGPLRAALRCLLAIGWLPLWPGLPAVGADEPLAVGAIDVSVRFVGTVPRVETADNLGRRPPLLHVDPKLGGLADAVAFLVGDLPTPPRPDQPPAEVTIDQKDETFVPHVVAVTAGTVVRFTNGDAGNHNVHARSLDPRNQFNVFTPPGQEHAATLKADPKGRPVSIRCSIHAWMSAWIYVFDHPWHAVTDGAGKCRLERVPVGKRRLIVRQPDGGLHHEVDVEVRPGERTAVTVTFEDRAVKS
jgi:plastocyanin